MYESNHQNNIHQIRDQFSSAEKHTPNQSLLNRKITKKDALKQKISIKHIENAANKKAKNINFPSQQRANQKQNPQNLNKNQNRCASQSNPNHDYHRPLQFLNKIMYKPPYLSFLQGNIVAGNFGHATTVFKRPILEGPVFMQFKIKEDIKKDKQVKNESSVRFGLCVHNFNIAFPIGRQESIAYKSSDGTIYYQGQNIHKGQKYGIGDTIGIYVRMSAPYKHPNINQISQNSRVYFFKNGDLIYIFEGLKQTFYCFSLSLYNYSKVQILPNIISISQYCNVEYHHYYNTLKEKILYKDLDEKGIFKI